MYAEYLYLKDHADPKECHSTWSAK